MSSRLHKCDDSELYAECGRNILAFLLQPSLFGAEQGAHKLTVHQKSKCGHHTDAQHTALQVIGGP